MTSVLENGELMQEDLETSDEPAVKVEALAPKGSVTIHLAGEKITILAREDWFIGAVTALQESRFDDWAEGVMTEDSFDTWVAVHPTIGEVDAMFREYYEATGQTENLSRAQRRVSTRSRKKSK